jgi:hypothetical protein
MFTKRAARTRPLVQFAALLLVLGGAVMPLVAEAVSFTAPLVPDACQKAGPFDCGFCELIDLIQNVINFLIFLATFAATLLFVYAGFLYLTAAGNKGQISRAHSIFVSVLIGFVVLLAGWLIIDLMMKAFVSDDFLNDVGPWNDPNCAEEAEVTTDGDDDSGPDSGTDSFAKSEAEEDVRNELGSAGVSVNKNHCPPDAAYQEVAGGCTDTSGFQDSTVEDIKTESQDCESQVGSCNFVITGGSEDGHATGERSHGNGYKYDVRKTDGVNNYVQSDSFTDETNCSGRTGYRNKETGNCWYNEGDHWDVKNAG